MKIYLKILVYIAFLVSLSMHQVTAQNLTKAHMDSLDAMVIEYYDLNIKVFQANSTVEDIDKVFELFADDFTYVHPKYGGVYTREDLYNGYVRNQENGGYNGDVTDIKILNKIIGLNAVTVYRIFVEKDEAGVKDGEPAMTLFEFSDGKISRIFEYW